VDVALAVGCEGVHLGQDDMSKSLHAAGFPRKLISTSIRIGEEASS
jgi:thiamine monophosphate synthase